MPLLSKEHIVFLKGLSISFRKQKLLIKSQESAGEGRADEGGRVNQGWNDPLMALQFSHDKQEKNFSATFNNPG